MKKLLAVLMFGCIASSVFADTYFDVNAGIDTHDNNLALAGDVGYMFNRYYGLEGGITGSDNYFMYDVAAKGVLPLANMVSLYGKLGVGISNYDGMFSNSEVGLLYGAGVSFKVSRSFELHIEDYTVSGSSPNLLMFGGHFSF